MSCADVPLIKNHNNECWANALVHLLFNSPIFRRVLMHAHQVTPECSWLVDLWNSYHQDHSVDTRVIRRFFESKCDTHREAGGVGKGGNAWRRARQHDAQEALFKILDLVKTKHYAGFMHLEETKRFVVDHERGALTEEDNLRSVTTELGADLTRTRLLQDTEHWDVPIWSCVITGMSAARSSMETLIGSYFTQSIGDKDESAKYLHDGQPGWFKPTALSYALTNVPEAFFLIPYRFMPVVGGGGSNRKLRDALQLRLATVLPLSAFRSDVAATVQAPETRLYVCRGMVFHHGDDCDSGHYTALMRRGAQWYYCDDDKPTVEMHADSAEFQAMLTEDAYILLFERKLELTLKNKAKAKTTAPTTTHSIETSASSIEAFIHQLTSFADNVSRCVDLMEEDSVGIRS